MTGLSVDPAEIRAQGDKLVTPAGALEAMAKQLEDAGRDALPLFKTLNLGSEFDGFTTTWARELRSAEAVVKGIQDRLHKSADNYEKTDHDAAKQIHQGAQGSRP